MWSYKDFCPRYYEGCFKCPDYLGTEELYFCRKANIARFGVERVSGTVWTDDNGDKHLAVVTPPTMEDVHNASSGGLSAAWWNGRNKKKGAE